MFESRSRLPLGGRLLIELLVVFVGVWGAFLVEGWREDRQREERERQIYGALMREISEFGANSCSFAREIRRTDSIFTARMGEGDPLRPIPMIMPLDVTPHMWNATLQAGGLEILDVRTMYDVSSFYNNLAIAFAELEALGAFSRDVLIPNVDRPLSEFYDPETHRPRPRYEAYFQSVNNLTWRSAQLVVEARGLIRDLTERFPEADPPREICPEFRPGR